ncbi:L-serine ammonia-lyase, iron-sulfur-dependent, subunit beta [Paenibacillus sp. CAA11]|uniref:L-serine ammonia-lyase, iron-sulfur-dependent subunit beta n=1 Tax=Paenibacillus sp. CAA11 TaxID=1532905 RepID=UPI000D3C134A|nr:L-serine ammonia-lyase, iron-sulfur-dependent subunit beta [Paenibacillus sp. CAA11]AWB43997.1 L-serine ammonia-lyase, iron-sulfur-dependent, subunit beta [Paenibacillus sp. CAA11]
MRFKDVFSIIGPVMVGPSSSHTAGAARIGRVARHLLGKQPEEAVITFYGSFAATYQGHGTDRAIVGGLLDYTTDDSRIPTALLRAEEAGMTVRFEEGRGGMRHPNTARIEVTCDGGQTKLSIIGISIGGGNIEIQEIDDFNIKLTGIYPTLVIRHFDLPGVIAGITRELSTHGVNIAHMSVDRKSRNGLAMTVVELDGHADESAIQHLQEMESLKWIGRVDLSEPSAVSN